MSGRLGDMEPELFYRIIDQMAQHPGTALVPFFRGESMLHPQFLELLTYARRRDIAPIQFTTNATRMTPEISRVLVDLEIDFISFSLDSVDPQVYAAVRRGAKLETVLERIQYFCDYRRQQQADKPRIQVSVVSTRATAAGVQDFVSYWRNEVDRVRVYEEHSQDGNFGSLASSCDRQSPQRQACHKPFTDMVVYWDGGVALCNHDWDRQNLLGNLRRQSIAEVWNGANYRTIRKAHSQDIDRLEKLCRNCDHWRAYYLPDRKVGELYEFDTGI
jgi:radical SAM protein with 4Fe4S-binding SPASM domain